MIKGCNYFEFATCVSYVYSYFDPSMVRQCLPGCTDSGYEQSRIQVFIQFYFFDFVAVFLVCQSSK